MEDGKLIKTIDYQTQLSSIIKDAVKRANDSIDSEILNFFADCGIDKDEFNLNGICKQFNHSDKIIYTFEYKDKRMEIIKQFNFATPSPQIQLFIWNNYKKVD